jgi:hypothetical protein
MSGKGFFIMTIYDTIIDVRDGFEIYRVMAGFKAKKTGSVCYFFSPDINRVHWYIDREIKDKK